MGGPPRTNEKTGVSKHCGYGNVQPWNTKCALPPPTEGTNSDVSHFRVEARGWEAALPCWSQQHTAAPELLELMPKRSEQDWACELTMNRSFKSITIHQLKKVNLSGGKWRGIWYSINAFWCANWVNKSFTSWFLASTLDHGVRSLLDSLACSI